MKKYLLLIPCICLLVGCADTPMANEFIAVGSTNGNNVINGKQLYQLTVHNNGDHHYIYFFKDEGPQPISVNYRSGKQRRVVVYIDDKPASTNYIIVEDPVK